MQTLTKYNVDYYQGKFQDDATYFLFKRPGPIHIRASFLAGCRFDSIPGIAHFLEHMLLAGSQKYPNKHFLTIPLENIGGTIGGRTSNDLISIKLEVAEKKDLPLAIDILNEVINRPLFDEGTIENERGSILTERQVGYHNRDHHILDVANSLVFQDTPYSKIAIGDEASIKSIQKQDLVNYYNKIFKQNPASWTIAGDIDEQEIADYLAPLHPSTTSMADYFDKELPIIRKKQQELEIFEGNRADVYFGFRTDPTKPTDVYSLAIILSFLTQGRGCKLQDELRYKRGLIYGIQGKSFFGFDVGEWYIVTSCMAENVQEILDIITEQIISIKKHGINDPELKSTKSKIIQNNITKMQTAESWARMGDSPDFIANPEKFLITNYEKGIENTTNESIIATAQKYFTSDNWYLAMCGPESLNDIGVNL